MSEGMYHLHAITVAPDCTRVQVLGCSDAKIIPELQNWWTQGAYARASHYSIWHIEESSSQGTLMDT